MADKSKFYETQVNKQTILLAKNAEHETKVIAQVLKAQQDALDKYEKEVKGE